MKSIDLIVTELKKKGVKAQKINKRNLSIEFYSSYEKNLNLKISLFNSNIQYLIVK